MIINRYKKKQPKDLGVCQFCGEPVKEFYFGWGCSNRGCGSVIYKDDKFFKQVLGHKISKGQAISLLTGSTVSLRNIEIKGETHDVQIGLGYDRSGTYKYRYTMMYMDKDKKKDDEKKVTGFDVLNGD